MAQPNLPADAITPPFLPPGKASAVYTEQQTLTESPALRVLHAYDVVIAACHRRESDPIFAAVEALLDALDYNQPDLANRFETVYVHSLALVPTGRFDEVLRIFKRLRASWAEMIGVAL
ncbi:MAG: hypothetical protein QF886_23485 [Planctomycetota bacterium]|nr:hypothetical protein [Planctomycetota bacterium]